MQDADMMQQIATGQGFIAALDQSGGSTPGALMGYGIGEDAYGSEDEMFGLIHAMRSRIITSPSFGSGKVIGAILFERTMDGNIDGKPVPDVLKDRGIVPFLKVDKGLEDEADGVKLMKPMPGLGDLLKRAKAKGIFGTKMRSVIERANPAGIAAIVEQQFQVANEIVDAGLMPIIEPEISLKSPERAEADVMLHRELVKALDALPDDRQVMLKLSLPAKAGLYDDIVDHPRVLRIVALSGGYSREDACRELAKNKGMIASFSRALLSELRHDMSDDEFDAKLGEAIDGISAASAT
ncbi:fructose bisphosphate aldolase [Sphingorhabdus soli]|uniref:fructose-bisphosphate aldolase n=1 Tax=Flavisphingopyxis soli TaxID=2601267 RepID=A0A5C6U854_9SPHN|nr:fructose bisphosphate aldolase [Sphingorhabdus soli]TXC69227.1 fructose bisphosphate aldolase [Sphingorhabdus soli]